MEYVYRYGVMNGTNATTFESNAALNRVMEAQILYNLEGQPDVIGESTFADASGHWASNTIAWAHKIADTQAGGRLARPQHQPNYTTSKKTLLVYMVSPTTLISERYVPKCTKTSSGILRVQKNEKRENAPGLSRKRQIWVRFEC